MAPRNDEARTMAARLESIVGILEAASQPDADRPDFKLLARQLFPAAHMFESLGFQSVAREVSYVEKALTALAPHDEPLPASPQPTPRPEQPDDAGERVLDRPVAHAEGAQTPAIERYRVPVPLALMVVVLLGAIAGSIVVVNLHGERQRRALAASLVSPTPKPTEPPPTATPEPFGSVASGRGEIDAAALRVQVADEIGQARLALQEGDIERAMKHVSAAAVLDFSSSLVIATAQSIVNELIARADRAAEGGYWDQVEPLLEQARVFSLRFGFPVEAIDRARRRHASLDRFERLHAHDVAALRAATGKRVHVFLASGKIEKGRIHGVSADALELDQSTTVGDRYRGGALYYVEPIPLDLITEVRVYDD